MSASFFVKYFCFVIIIIRTLINATLTQKYLKLQVPISLLITNSSIGIKINCCQNCSSDIICERHYLVFALLFRFFYYYLAVSHPFSFLVSLTAGWPGLYGGHLWNPYSLHSLVSLACHGGTLNSTILYSSWQQ